MTSEAFYHAVETGSCMADLRDVGLSEYEARAYRGLLESGPATAKELSEQTGVPMGRVYDVLNGLQRERLVRSQAASRPKRYVAVEPDTALERLLEEKRRTLRREERQFEDAVESLTAELERSDEPEEGFWTAAVGGEETADLLVERIAAATDRIVVIAATPIAGLDPGEVGPAVTDALAEALDRGVDVSVLLSESAPADLPPSVGRRYADRLADHPRFAVRTHPSVRGTVTLVDGQEACLAVPSPIDPDRTFAVIDLTDQRVARDVRERFRDRWGDAKPFEFGT